MNLIQCVKKSMSLMVAGILVGSVVVGCAGRELSRGPVNSADGTAHMTFSEPLPAVSAAALGALERMGINVESREKSAAKEVIKAEAAPLQVEVRLEAITPKTTRMEVMAKEGLLSRDQATAMEIAMQTDRALHESWSMWR